MISSAAYLRKRSGSPAAQRYSTCTLRPSAQPASCSPCRNVPTRASPSASSAATPMSTPMRRRRSACCARTLRGGSIGATAAAAPRSVMNSRRRMASPLGLCGLFDHLVGEREQLGGDVDAEGLGGLHIDQELELGRLLHRQVRRLLALENTVDIAGGKAVLLIGV